MKTFTLPDLQYTLRYHDLPGGDIPLLFVHGLGCAASCDYPQIAAHPSLANRRRILPDLLGSGFSDRPVNFSYRTTDHAQTLVELINHLDFDELDLYGHSMGGAIAIEVATVLPHKIRHLVLSEPNLDMGGGFFSKKIAATDEAAYIAHGHDQVIEQSIENKSETWAASMRNTAAYAVHRAATSLIEGVTPVWRERLYTLPMSKTVIFGEHSLPDIDVERLKEYGIKTVVLNGASHSMAWEKPSELAALIGVAWNCQNFSTITS